MRIELNACAKHTLLGKLHAASWQSTHSHAQNKFEEKWCNHIEPKLREEAAARQREEAETLRSLRAAAVAARGERLAAQVSAELCLECHSYRVNMN